MSAETAYRFQALEDQAQQILGVFCKAGYEAVAPSIIQPADIFLNVVGEDLRNRTYVFTDPEGAELCLRPDLTVPTCRLHKERHHDDKYASGHYCYNGPAFRFQPGGGSAVHPREFRQAGIEHFGSTQYEAAETEVLVLIIEALKTAGLKEFSIRIGDIGIFEALLDTLDITSRWRQRLKVKFWHPDDFRAELKELSTRPAVAIDLLPKDLLADIFEAQKPAVEQVILDYLERNHIELIGLRSVAEIAENLVALVEDASAQPLSAATRELIENYLGVDAPVRAAGARMSDLIHAAGRDLSGSLDRYDRRLKHFASAGIDLSRLHFSAEFGRRLEYYTGFVFEVHAPELGSESPVAGGGRYDTLMRTIGAPADVPAIGAMIHTERLLKAVKGGE